MRKALAPVVSASPTPGERTGCVALPPPARIALNTLLSALRTAVLSLPKYALPVPPSEAISCSVQQTRSSSVAGESHLPPARPVGRNHRGAVGRVGGRRRSGCKADHEGLDRIQRASGWPAPKRWLRSGDTGTPDPGLPHPPNRGEGRDWARRR